MLTYQDLIKINPADEALRINFVNSAIQEHKSSEIYKTAIIAEEYDKQQNRTIRQYEKTLRTITGQQVPDRWSPNWKTCSNFFNRFVTQQNQYLLGNGVAWNEDATAEKLGKDFDTQLQKAGKAALVGGEAFGFFNYDHLEVFALKEFKPLYDEENGALRAGIRFWQVDNLKPMRATLYEEDGYTDFIWNWTENTETALKTQYGAVLVPKRTYKQIVTHSEVDGTEIFDGENYPTFPIVPLWGNPHHQSELVGIRESIDAYDFIKNGYLNDLDTAQIYWILKGAGGVDDEDMVKFLERLHMLKMANLDPDQEAQPVTVEIPYEAREKLLDRIERDLYRDYMALNVEDIKGGAVTATQIMAAYEPLNTKTDQYEYCVIEFIHGLLKVAGIEDEPTFTRSRLVNTSEDVGTVISAASYLDGEYVTRKILDLLGDGDQADDVLKRKDAEDMERMERMQSFGGGNGDEDDDSGEKGGSDGDDGKDGASGS